jgi:uncharacterized protein YkwD
VRRAVLTPLAGTLAALALVACGGDDDGDTERAERTAPTTEGTVAPQVNEGEIGDSATSSGEGEQVADVSEPIEPGDAEPTPEEEEGVAGGAACRNLDVAATASNTRAIDTSILCLLNGVRRDHSLRPLKRDRALKRAASTHGRDLVARHYFEHQSKTGRTHTDRIRAAGYMRPGKRWVVGENLAWGLAAYSAPRAILHGWMKSPPHRANILHTRYREIGVAVIPDVPPADKSGGATYVTTFGVLR